jgi:hypothetical protein
MSELQRLKEYVNFLIKASKKFQCTKEYRKGFQEALDTVLNEIENIENESITH